MCSTASGAWCSVDAVVQVRGFLAVITAASSGELLRPQGSEPGGLCEQGAPPSPVSVTVDCRAAGAGLRLPFCRDAGTQGEPDPVPGLRGPTSSCWRACRGTRPRHWPGRACPSHGVGESSLSGLGSLWHLSCRQGPIGRQLARLFCAALSLPGKPSPHSEAPMRSQGADFSRSLSQSPGWGGGGAGEHLMPRELPELVWAHLHREVLFILS